MADPDSPARPAPYVGGINQTYPGSGNSGTTPVAFIQNPPRIDARGWLRIVVTYLTGRRNAETGAMPIVKPAGDRPQMTSTERDLQTGPSPVGITRIQTRKIGGSASSRGMGTFPPTGGWAYIPHLDLARDSLKMAGKAVPALRTVDDHASIPAIFAGNPQVNDR